MKYTSTQAVDALNAISGDDPERAHSEADEAVLEFLLDMGHEEVYDAYHGVIERSDWWACA